MLGKPKIIKIIPEMRTCNASLPGKFNALKSVRATSNHNTYRYRHINNSIIKPIATPVILRDPIVLMASLSELLHTLKAKHLQRIS